MKKYEHVEIKHEFDVTLKPIVNHVVLYDGTGKKLLPELKDKDFISTLNYFGEQGWAAVNFSHSMNEDIVTSIALLRRGTQSQPSELSSAIENAIKKHPHQRLGQLLVNTVGIANKNLFYITNEQLTELLNEVSKNVNDGKC